jgi:CRISPR-associated protein Cas1
MEQKIIDISEEAAGLSVRNSQLVIQTSDREFSAPLEEIAGLVVSHPGAHYTHATLAGVCANGGTVVLCNEKRLPIGMLLPLAQNYVQTERMASQLTVTVPRKKQLWRQIVVAKVRAQGRLLELLHGDDHGLARLARTVKSGDTSNVEAQAARRYWPVLIDPAFRRIPGRRDFTNSALNYGYAVLRGIIARAVCAVGLHPSLGLHHHNRYNPFSLIDDVMEPYRPLVDHTVCLLDKTCPQSMEMDRDVKAALIRPLMNRRHEINGESRSLFDIAARTATSLFKAFGNPNGRLQYPELTFEDDTEEEDEE